jgi:hypothetical protein
MKFNPIGVGIEHMDSSLNSYYDEYAVIDVNDTMMLFSSMMPDSTGLFYSRIHLIYKVADSVIYRGGVLDSLINEHGKNVANPFFDVKTSELFFTKVVQDSTNYYSMIYKSFLTDSGWTKPVKLSLDINFPGSNNTQAAIAYFDDTRYIIWSSDRKGAGSYDLWFCKYTTDGMTGSPIEVGIDTKDIDTELAFFFESESKINTLGNEITPFFSSKDSMLYFSSDWHVGMGGYDIFKTKTDFKTWSDVENVGYPLNTSVNDLYFTMDANSHYAYFVSNRHSAYTKTKEGCCNDIYRIKLPEEIDTVEIEKNKINTFTKEIKLLVPLTLYFHNDEPDPNTTDTVTHLNYEECVDSYMKRLDEYKEQYSVGLKREEKDQAQLDIENFFRDSIEKGYRELILFAELTEELLGKGQNIEITIKGYTSPLFNTDYNKKLAKRRTSSLLNYFKEYKDSIFEPYELSGQLVYEQVAIGEELVNENVSDDASDVRNSVYSPDAAAERRIQIIAVSVADVLKEE